MKLINNKEDFIKFLELIKEEDGKKTVNNAIIYGFDDYQIGFDIIFNECELIGVFSKINFKNVIFYECKFKSVAFVGCELVKFNFLRDKSDYGAKINFLQCIIFGVIEFNEFNLSNVNLHDIDDNLVKIDESCIGGLLKNKKIDDIIAEKINKNEIKDDKKIEIINEIEKKENGDLFQEINNNEKFLDNLIKKMTVVDGNFTSVSKGLVEKAEISVIWAYRIWIFSTILLGILIIGSIVDVHFNYSKNDAAAFFKKDIFKGYGDVVKDFPDYKVQVNQAAGNQSGSISVGVLQQSPAQKPNLYLSKDPIASYFEYLSGESRTSHYFAIFYKLAIGMMVLKIYIVIYKYYVNSLGRRDDAAERQLRYLAGDEALKHAVLSNDKKNLRDALADYRKNYMKNFLSKDDDQEGEGIVDAFIKQIRDIFGKK